MPELRTRTSAPTVVPDSISLPPRFPGLPEDVLRRFPSLARWQEDTSAWWRKASYALQDNNRWVSQSVTKANKTDGDLRVSINGATAAIETLSTAFANSEQILARRIVTVSAIAGVSQAIKVQGTAPVAPSVNDYWVDNSDPLEAITYQWSGAAWVEVTEPISAVAVADERSARITADGYLEGGYKLNVIAGDVVTGMTLLSASGPGTSVSQVIFQADKFQIYNGSSGVAAFSLSGGNLTLSGSITLSYSQVSGLGSVATWNGVDWTDLSGRPIDGNGKLVTTPTPTGSGLFLGSTHLGYYTGGSWRTYMDSSGNFYLGGTSGALTWNGSTLSVSGTVTSTSGSIGGFTLGATTLSSGSSSNFIQISSGTPPSILIGSNAANVVNLSLTAGGLTFSDSTSPKVVVGAMGSVGSRYGQAYLVNASNNVVIDLDASDGSITCSALYVG
jgi:hypothetical protein